MNTFVINQTPFERGMRPRGFFPERKRNQQNFTQKTNVEISIYSSWSSSSTKKNQNRSFTNPDKRIFLESISWAMSLSLLVYNTICLFV